MNTENEVWKDIKDYEGIYQVSNLGRVKSLPRKGRKTELILTPTPNTVGYLIVGLRKKGYKVKSMLVHRLVLMAFDPIPDTENVEGNHKDFDITNNKLSNLEWTTSQQNTDHFIRSGKPKDKTKTTGSNHHLSKLTDKDVLDIRAMHATGEYSVNGLAKILDMPESTLRLIVKGVTWKHLL